jgi:hypothetical protein
MEVCLHKVAGGLLAPATDADAESLADVSAGIILRCKVTQMRNARFHRKFFAMLDVGYDAWEPPAEVEIGGKTYHPQKNRERFREDCIISAGFYDVVVNLKGEVRAQAHSISFSNMDEIEFRMVYSAVADVILQRVLTNYTREDLDNVVDRILGFTR